MRKKSSILLLFILTACSALKNPFVQNRFVNYRFPLPSPSMEMQYWSLSQDSVAIRLRFLSSELGLMPDVAGLKPRRRLLIRATFYPEFKKKKPVWSPPLVLESSIEDTSTFLGAELHLPMGQGSEGLLVIDARDLQKNRTHIRYQNLSRLEAGSALDFHVVEKGNPSIHPWLKQGVPCNINYVNPSEDQFVLEHYTAEFPLPAPPFAVSSEQNPFPSPFLKEQISKEDLLEFRFEKLEFLKICSEKYPQSGFGLIVVGKNFPGLSSDAERFRSLVYLMQKEEIKQNLGVEDFHLWKFLGHDRAHSEAVENAWMERIRQANILFTTYTSGWRTDRGMIYTIFGPPSSVFNNGRAEEWNYTPQSSLVPLNFRFERSSNAFSQDDYRLERRASYTTFWYKAVESWRNGNAFTYE